MSFGNQNRHLLSIDGRRVDQLIGAAPQVTQPTDERVADTVTTEPVVTAAEDTADAVVEIVDTVEPAAADPVEAMWTVDPVDFRRAHRYWRRPARKRG